LINLVHRLKPYEKVRKKYEKVKEFDTLKDAKSYQKKIGIFGFVQRIGIDGKYALYKKVK